MTDDRIEVWTKFRRCPNCLSYMNKAPGELERRLAEAEARNECHECGLTPGPTANRWCEECVGDNSRLRGLLREACEMARAPDDDPERWYGNEITDEWFDRAAKMGGDHAH
jgi:hypothetical protein